MHTPLPWSLVPVAVRTAVVVIALVAGLRVVGRRDVGGLNIIDLVLVLLLGNAVQNAITSGSGALAVGLVSAATLLLLDHVLGIVFVREPWLEGRLFGEPVVIASNGRLDTWAMRREGIEEDEVLAAAREQGVADLSQVRLAVLEDDGTISIIPKEHEDG
jgi:uncharacterized membrane protein YcaP (DUF421 family)